MSFTGYFADVIQLGMDTSEIEDQLEGEIALMVRRSGNSEGLVV